MEVHSENTMDVVMSMPPGGTFEERAEGQITDDSEMALAMINALAEAESGEINLSLLGKWYINWINSSPFDIGISTQNALFPLVES